MTVPKTDAPSTASVDRDTHPRRGDDRVCEPRGIPPQTEPSTDLVHTPADADAGDDDRGESAAGQDRAPAAETELTAEQRARLRKRLAATLELARRAGTDGEKAAAIAAISRISARLGEDPPDINKPADPPFTVDFDFDAYFRRTSSRTARRPRESVFEAWLRTVEVDEVFVDIFTEWAARARSHGWHEGAVRAAQDYAAEYGVTPDEVDLGM